MARASMEIDRLIAEQASIRPGKPAVTVVPLGASDTVEFWYYAHPLMARAFAAGGPAASDTRTTHQYIGEWPAAVQKLTAALAADDLPDVAMVKRALVAKLFDAGRIRALDSLLPPTMLEDLRAEAREDYTYDGHLVALPADGFCSVLFSNVDAIGSEPPRNWKYLSAYQNARRVALGSPPGRSLGYFPFLEALWSTGGDVLHSNRSALNSPEAMRALEFTLERRGGIPGDEEAAFAQYLRGELPMTVAQSNLVVKTRALAFPERLAPVPGETGPISRRSNDALVVFVRGQGACAASLSSFLDWLTGPQVMGERAAHDGSVPIRKSVQAEGALPEGVLDAYVAAKNTPLHPEWGAVEAELALGLAEAYRAVTERP